LGREESTDQTAGFQIQGRGAMGGVQNIPCERRTGRAGKRGRMAFIQQRQVGRQGGPCGCRQQRQGIMRQGGGRHVARRGLFRIAAAGVPETFGFDGDWCVCAVIHAAAALGVAVRGGVDSGQEGICRQCRHQHQAKDANRHRLPIMPPNGFHGSYHKLDTTMCQSEINGNPFL